MNFSSRIAQLIHEDHSETVALIELLEDMIAKAGRKTPDIADDTVNKTLKKTADLIAHETRHHFQFEENKLFPILEEAGDQAIGAHLREEHAAILPLGEQVESMANSALADGFNDRSWSDFRNLTGEMTERMLAHIQKEEMALLPLLEDMLDPETDMELSEAFAAA